MKRKTVPMLIAISILLSSCEVLHPSTDSCYPKTAKIVKGPKR